MKVRITESQVENLIRVFSKFLNRDLLGGVCNVMVDYDEIMDRFVLNIFFDRKYIVKLDDGGKQSSFIRKTVHIKGLKQILKK